MIPFKIEFNQHVPENCTNRPFARRPAKEILEPPFIFNELTHLILIMLGVEPIYNSVFSMAMVYTKQLVQLFGLPNSWSKP